MSSANHFMEILDRSNVYDVLFDHSSPATMYRVGWTCWMARRAVQDYSRRTFNINRHLRRFFDDPIGFRSLQAQTGTLISGAFAHRFLDRTLCDKSRLELYTYPQHAAEVGRWVMRNGGKGYRFKALRGQNRDFDVCVTESLDWGSDSDGDDDWDVNLEGIRNLLTFVADEDVSPLTVRIIVSPFSPLMILLHQWHSTAFMNVITFSAAYSSHPFATFEERKSLAIGYSEEHWMIDRRIGYDVIDSALALERRPSKSFILRDRWADDELSWVLPFDMSGVSWPKLSPKISQLSFDPFSVNGWGLVRFEHSEVRHNTYLSIDQEIFKFQYCCTESFYEDVKDTILAVVESERAERSNDRDWSWYDEVLYYHKRRKIVNLQVKN
ncbi:hypothetical protein BD410DRAFT_315159 [Rickenella mellea]|uniref:Uncharacterized protein n=1 Tax=Rickenella mellea TaxID=50990 RepID=A0A4Y7Q0D0_9AGAM|nr:hypothetical protein BD410DRAFT_315159 [Rickenella mellea]